MIVFAKKWEVLPYHDVLKRYEPRMVMQACAHPQRRLFCAPCDTPLANPAQVSMHHELTPDVTHTIVDWCDRHHTYEVANPIALPAVTRTLPLFEEKR